jgi:hypothetical protein
MSHNTPIAAPAEPSAMPAIFPAVLTGFAHLSVITTGYDTRSIGSARKNGPRVNPNAALSFCDIQ